MADVVGKELTVTTALPLWACEHAVELPSRTLNKLYVYVPVAPVGTDTVTVLLVEATTVWLPPPLIL